MQFSAAGLCESQDLGVCMLAVQACVPYFEMLEKWIYKGIIQDPYAEVRMVMLADCKG